MEQQPQNITNILVADHFQSRTVMIDGQEINPAAYQSGYIEIKDTKDGITYRFWEAGRGPILKYKPHIHCTISGDARIVFQNGSMAEGPKPDDRF